MFVCAQRELHSLHFTEQRSAVCELPEGAGICVLFVGSEPCTLAVPVRAGQPVVI